MSPCAIHGRSVERAAGIDFKKDKGRMCAGRDTDGTEALVYFNDDAKAIACTEIEPDGE